MDQAGVLCPVVFGGPQVDVPLESLVFQTTSGEPWSATMVLPDGNTIDWAGKFVEVAPNESLVFTMTDQPHEPGRALITVKLAEIPQGTRLHFTQETPGFTSEQKEQLVAGWLGFLDELATIARS